MAKKEGKTTTRKMSFTYEPLQLTRLLMQIHIEKYFDTEEGDRKTEAHRFANFDFLSTMDDEELTAILHDFIKKEGYEEITFEDTDHDFRSIFEIVHTLPRFIELENSFIKKGRAGKGVFDEKANKFYSCGFAGHWEAISTIIKDHYPQYFEAFEEFTLDDKQTEYKGITRKYLDDFIMSNFTLIGEWRRLEGYLQTYE